MAGRICQNLSHSSTVNSICVFPIHFISKWPNIRENPLKKHELSRKLLGFHIQIFSLAGIESPNLVPTKFELNIWVSFKVVQISG